jgi:hypothetical protein
MDRGVSEMGSMLALVAVALVIVLAVGANVLFVESDDSPGPDATFSFNYIQEQQSLVITHEGGDPVPARDLRIEGPGTSVLWSQVNSQVDNSTIVTDQDALLIGTSNGYGSRVRPSHQISVVYVNRTATPEPITLSQWNGTDNF